MTENPINSKPTAPAMMVAKLSTMYPMSGRTTAGRPTRHLGDEFDATVTKVEYQRRDDAQDHREEGARDLRGVHGDAEDQDQRRHTDDDRGVVGVGKARDPCPQLPPRVGTAGIGAGDLQQLRAATFIATPNVNPVRTLAARKSEIQPIFSTYMMTKSAPATRTIEAAS